MPDHKLQATFKLGTGYDEAWVSVSSDDPNEFVGLIHTFRDQLSNEVADTAQIVRATNEAYRSGIVTSSAVTTAVHQPVQQAPVASQPVYSAPVQQVPTVQYQAPVQQPAPVAAGPLPTGVTITNDGINAYIEFPFNRAFNDVVKGIGGRFDKTSKRWYVPAASEGQLRAVAAQNLG